MNPRIILLCTIVVGAFAALPQATACIEVEPRHQAEFEEGSATLAVDQKIKLMQMLSQAGHRRGDARVSVRGYADSVVGFDPKNWSKEDLALAKARARALATAARELGITSCVERVAIGSAPADSPPARVDAKGSRWNARAVLVLAKPDSVETQQAGFVVENDCTDTPPKLEAPRA